MSKWVNLEGRYINTDKLAMFYWQEGELILHYAYRVYNIKDPDRTLFIALATEAF